MSLCLDRNQPQVAKKRASITFASDADKKKPKPSSTPQQPRKRGGGGGGGRVYQPPTGKYSSGVGEYSECYAEFILFCQYLSFA